MPDVNEGHLYTAIHRTGHGLGTLTLIDPVSFHIARIPESRTAEVVDVLPEIRLAVEALRNLPSIGHSHTFSLARPTRTDRAFERIESWFEGQHSDADRTTRISFEKLDQEEIKWEVEEALAWHHLEWCLELGLHQWRQIPNRNEWRCGACGGSANLILETPEPALDRVLRELLVADPWRAAANTTFERFRRDDERQLRLVLDPAILKHNGGREQSLETRLLREFGPRASKTLLVALPDDESIPRGIACAKLNLVKDVHGIIHEYADVPTAGDGRDHVELGEAREVTELSQRLDAGDRSDTLARTVLLGREYGHATVTEDSHLVDLHDRRARNVMTPKAAVILLGIHARHQGRVPVGPYSILRHHFYDDRALALLPELSRFILDAAAAVEASQVPRRVMRLVWTTVERFGLLARSEDEIAFQDLFANNRHAGREIIYHFDYLLLLARALIEGLGEIAATIHLPKRSHGSRESLSWDVLRAQLTKDASPLADFLRRKSAVYRFSELVSTLRNPIAHAEGLHKTNSNLGPSISIEGPDALNVAAAIRRMGASPLNWGISGQRMEDGELSLQLDPYPFAVNLNMYLLSVVGPFLTALGGGASFPAADRVPPWKLVNPPLDERAFSVIRAMSWPMPEVDWTTPLTGRVD